MDESIEEFWERFLLETKQNKDEVGFSGELVFEDQGVTGVEQLSLVLNGRKTVSFTPLEVFEINMEPVPVTGEIYIVEDGDDKPRCIIELTDVSVISFGDISWELASRDGEDENLEQWREKQMELMGDEADLCGFEFNDSTKIVCEVFRVIFRG